MRPPISQAAAACSNLEDSTFEVIPDDNVIVMSDDEGGHTESLASTDDYTDNDTSSLCCTEDEHDEEDAEGVGSDLREGTFEFFAPQHGQIGVEPGRPLVTQRPKTVSTPSKSAVSRNLGLPSRAEATLWKDEQEIEVFDRSNVPTIFRELCMPSLKIVRHLTRSDRLLRPSDPFRIWYFGEPDQKTAILDKIGSALYVGRSSNSSSQYSSDGTVKYNVTPVSSFTRDVALLPSSGIDLYVTECTVQNIEAGSNTTEAAVVLLLDDNVQLEIASDGSMRVCPPSAEETFQLPDLSVFCHTPPYQCMEENYSHDLISMARDAITSIGLPTLDVSSASTLPTLGESLKFGPGSLYMSLEGEASLDGSSQTIACFPISVQRLREMDPTVLNQHLEHITSLPSGERSQDTQKPSSVSKVLLSTVRKIFISDVFRAGVFTAAVLPLALWLTYTSWIFHFQSSLPLMNKFQSPLPIVAQTPLDSSKTLWVASSETSLAASVASQPTTSSLSSLVPLNAENGVGHPLWDTLRDLIHPPGQFEVEITGDCQLTITPPKWIRGSKQIHKARITVTRGLRVVYTAVTDISKLANSIEIPQSEANGALNVTIRTILKPIAEQTVEVTFPTSKKLSALSSFLEELHLGSPAQQDIGGSQHPPTSQPEQPIKDIRSSLWSMSNLSKVAIASLQENGHLATAEAQRLAASTAKTASISATTIADRLHRYTSLYSSWGITQVSRSVACVAKSKLVANARQNAKQLSHKLSISKPIGTQPNTTATFSEERTPGFIRSIMAWRKKPEA